ncbi:hypothetical protein ACTXT7_017382 [Hymenolepis weldensis]
MKRLLAWNEHGRRMSRAPLQQMPASGKEPHWLRSCTMATDGYVTSWTRLHVDFADLESELWKSTADFPGKIQINPASCVQRKIPRRGVDGSKVVNGA